MSAGAGAADGFPWLHHRTLAEVIEMERLMARSRAGLLDPGGVRRLRLLLGKAREILPTG